MFSVRFHTLIWAAGTVCLVIAAETSVRAEEGVKKQTFAYKQVDGHDILLDAYVPQESKSRGKRQSSRRAVGVWIHGGALINGHREGISRPVKDGLLRHGMVLISIDYRLAPETQLPQIISDVEDAFAWIRTQGAERLPIDPDRLVVLGGSAGGYLTLTVGHRVKPAPRGLVAFWGYGDLVGSWYSQPSPHPRHHRTKLDRAKAWKQVSGPPISDSRQRDGDGGAFYQYCRQHGSWPTAVSGWDPHKEAEKFAPFMPVKNVTSAYPPTLLIHGTDDTDVPYQQSVMMAEQFQRHSVRHRLITVEKGEHGLAGASRKEIEAAYEAAIEFAVKVTQAESR